MFLWRTGGNYLGIIIKYSSLTSPLWHISSITIHSIQFYKQTLDKFSLQLPDGVTGQPKSSSFSFFTLSWRPPANYSSSSLAICYNQFLVTNKIKLSALRFCFHHFFKHLMLTELITTAADDILIFSFFFKFFRENKTWNYM